MAPPTINSLRSLASDVHVRSVGRRISELFKSHQSDPAGALVILLKASQSVEPAMQPEAVKGIYDEFAAGLEMVDLEFQRGGLGKTRKSMVIHFKGDMPAEAAKKIGRFIGLYFLGYGVDVSVDLSRSARWTFSKGTQSVTAQKVVKAFEDLMDLCGYDG